MKVLSPLSISDSYLIGVKRQAGFPQGKGGFFNPTELPSGISRGRGWSGGGVSDRYWLTCK